MLTCPSCGHLHPAGARFCSNCGAALTAAPPPREERKSVTVLFADLVGFTSRAEALDPEDVRALLSPYFDRLRKELERHGGTVEKFIGDAVMALFGAPIAHEDDPERAVRAAIAIRDWVLEAGGELQLRIAVNTGEALVALGARAGEGEGMASGDVVNTAARLQSAAPVNGILVGETTHRATAHVIEYRPAGSVLAKGKDTPIPVWEALQARARLGVDVAPTSRAPLVGRVQELDLLSAALERTRRDRSTQLVTVVGVPGIGKTRMVTELFRRVEDDPSELFRWRQGRSLPYGEGVTLWALAEMVKAQAGILDTDDPETAEHRLAAAVGAVVPDSDAQWILGHLRPLAGLGSIDELSGDRQSEAFAAWRRFFEAIAEQNPLILVFEDLQWADDTLLDFIEHLVDWSSGVSLLVVCTTRPELFDRRPGWSGGKRNATTLSLSPLSDEEIARLIGSLVEGPLSVVETQQAVITRAGGNPLYTEQYLRMLAEREAGGDLALPETVQGIIAARLDALPVAEKAMLQCAAVMGKVFWVGALSAVEREDRAVVEEALHALERKEFIRRARRSSVADEAEYTFLHILVRDVAYGQIPRAQRAARHRLAASWIESLGRVEDHAEMLAHHHLAALDLDRAAGRPVDVGQVQHALELLGEAGDRAFSLNSHAGAERFYAAALELSSSPSAGHASLLFRLARARVAAGRADEDALLQTRDELVACDDMESAAEVEAMIAAVHWEAGERDAAFATVQRARELVDKRPASRSKAFVLSSHARFLMLAAEVPDAIRTGELALSMAEQLGLEGLRAASLINLGTVKAGTEDATGVEDLEKGIEIATSAGVPYEMSRGRGNLAAVLRERGELERASRLLTQAADIASNSGHTRLERWFRGTRGESLLALGRWDEALQGVDAFIAELEAGSPHYAAPSSYSTRAVIRFGRDDVAGALADAERALDRGRRSKDPQSLHPVLAIYSHLLREAGEQQLSTELAEEFLADLRAGRDLGYGIVAVHRLSWTVEQLGRGGELITALGSKALFPWVRAAMAYARGDLQGAADICASMGALTEEAEVRMQLAERLAGAGRREEAEDHARRALAFHRGVGATRYVRRGEALLAASV